MRRLSGPSPVLNDRLETRAYETGVEISSQVTGTNMKLERYDRATGEGPDSALYTLTVYKDARSTEVLDRAWVMPSGRVISRRDWSAIRADDRMVDEIRREQDNDF